MIPPTLADDIDSLIRRAHGAWLQAVCTMLSETPDEMDVFAVVAKLPKTNNSDAAHSLTGIIRRANGVLPWKTVGVSIHVCAAMYKRWSLEQQIELLWTGPSPAQQIPARRIDQVLYDLIGTAKREILLVTFAAYKISRLTDGLSTAVDRGIPVRLILEFEEASEGQLSMDALKAFPPLLRQLAQIYYWPMEKRERNAAGRPGKLHAKIAIVDDLAVISSANLTDDAFNRNLELGLLVSNGEILRRLHAHFDSLCGNGTLALWKP